MGIMVYSLLWVMQSCRIFIINRITINVRPSRLKAVTTGELVQGVSGAQPQATHRLLSSSFFVVYI